ncbi:MAG TPA: hypothetical protein VLD17_10410 [Gemmatimonadaceae bacterium]|nr:hypothetical protein [Gemmatimonadaceae bacterium]
MTAGAATATSATTISIVMAPPGTSVSLGDRRRNAAFRSFGAQRFERPTRAARRAGR